MKNSQKIISDSSDQEIATTRPLDIAAYLKVRTNGRDTNKGTFGHVFIIGGSENYVGAPILTAEAAARSGAGLVTLIVPKEIQAQIVSRISPAIITHGLNFTTGSQYENHAAEEALELTVHATAVAFGPGLGESDETADFVRKFVSACRAPLVIDADALNALAKESDHGEAVLRNRIAPTILTPHPGEMARFLACDIETIQNSREAAATNAAKRFGCIIVLKGAGTLIALPDGSLYLNPTGNPGMSTGGTGDVLTGIIAAFLAQGLEPKDAAVAGVFMHGLAGDLAARSHGEIGMIATDLIDELPHAISYIQNQSTQLHLEKKTCSI